MRKPIFIVKPNQPETIRTPEQQAAASRYMDSLKAMQKSSRIDLRSAPLRNVVDRDVMADLGLDENNAMVRIQRWKLECGHLVSPPSDIYGERFPSRMRCGQCQAKA